MQIKDLTVEVRNSALERVAQITEEDLVGFTVALRFNNVGSWKATLPANSFAAEALRQPGAGVIVTGPEGVIFTGPTTSAKKVQTTDDPTGTWEIEGVDDSILLLERLAYPDPTEPDAALQSVAYDEITGPVSTVLYHYVDANIGPSAPIERRIPNLELAADTSLGSTVTGRLRFDVIGSAFSKLVAPDGLGFDLKQQDGELIFQVYQPVDRSLDIRLDVENNRLSSSEYTYQNPRATRAIVAGKGQGELREIVEVATTESTLSETAWGRRIEVFKDQRDSEGELLEQSGFELLAKDGKTLEGISVKPSDDGLMRFGYDWNLGDKVSVVANEAIAVATVTEVAISVTESGVYILATVGEPDTASDETRSASIQSNQEERISSLERNEPTAGGDASGGLTPGGLEGQILAKLSDADFDATWIDNYAGELRIIVKNDSGVTISKGQAVMAVGSVGDRIRVAKANADGSVSARFMLGVASEDIEDSAEGYINLLGEIRQLNTSAFTVGTVLYIDPATPGALTSTEPTSPDLDMSVAIVTRQHASTGIIFVRMWNQGVDLGEVNDVNIASPSNGQLLAYNSTTGIWQNSSTLSNQVSSLSSEINERPISHNYVLNSAFDIWQRGTSFSGAVYGADRWRPTISSQSVSRSTNHPTGFNFSINVVRNTGTINPLITRIEANNSRLLIGKTVTLSFWARNLGSPVGMSAYLKAPTGFDNFADTDLIESRSVVSELSTSWTRYSTTFAALPSSVDRGLEIEIVSTTLSQGSTYSHLLTGVQLEEGSVVTPFKRNTPNFQSELAACQRYYNSSARIDMGYQTDPNGFGGSVYIAFPTTMRTTPTVTNSFTNFDNAVNGGTPTILPDGFSHRAFRNSTSFGYFRYGITYTATAEL
jgi:hypothetical protein